MGVVTSKNYDGVVYLHRGVTAKTHICYEVSAFYAVTGVWRHPRLTGAKMLPSSVPYCYAGASKQTIVENHI
ncbi:hypothetical protein AGMMS50229_13830 [Campylobacterota bacterium]|nr:hypothetical protein AGMMS50229_13830 [Campylobacterota bacterium]